MKAYKTVVPAGLKTIARRFWREARSLPAQAWRRWAVTLGIGVVLVSALSFVISLVAMGSEGLQAWDEQTLLAVSNGPMSFARGVTWESPGNLVGSGPMLLTFIALTSWFSRPLVAATVAMGYGLQFVWVWTGWLTWNRQRPDLIADGIAAPGLHSFPSGHVAVVTTIYGLLFYLWFRSSKNWLERIVAIAFATIWIGMICMSRLVLGAHWPSDVIASLGLSLLWLAALIIALELSTRVAKSSKKL